MDDKKLLELAAKACGFELIDCTCKKWRKNSVTGKHWNPLTDDGDALRLAVKLKMSIEIHETQGTQWLISVIRDSVADDQASGDDPYTATRRAIVRAAAEIGKNLG